MADQRYDGQHKGNGRRRDRPQTAQGIDLLCPEHHEHTVQNRITIREKLVQLQSLIHGILQTAQRDEKHADRDTDRVQRPPLCRITDQPQHGEYERGKDDSPTTPMSQ